MGVNNGEPSAGVSVSETRLRSGVDGGMGSALAGEGIIEKSESAMTGGVASSRSGVEGRGAEPRRLLARFERDDVRERGPEGSTFSLGCFSLPLRLLPSFFIDRLRPSFSVGGSGGLGPHPGAKRGTVAVSVLAHDGSTKGFRFGMSTFLGAGTIGFEGPATGATSSNSRVRS